MQNPKILTNLLDEETFNSFKNSMQTAHKTFMHDPGFGRYCVGEGFSEEFKSIFDGTVAKAREVFGSDTLLPTYALFAHYEGNASLYRHKDDNACTYTLDMCLYQNEPWDLYVDGNPYTLFPNQALAYYGNDQEHWREAFPNPESQHVAMVFFHYAEPDHWYFTKGPRYIDVVRGMITEEQWAIRDKFEKDKQAQGK